ncbi:MAG TPA: hypothetical protein VKE42_06190 [Candidatus Cybelea sp.]|nr:hypothetical protein [Candidatus Cybelea sp.]
MTGSRFSNAQKHEAALREVAYRKRVYERRVNAAQMRRDQADYQIAIMSEIADDYRALAERDNPKLI